MCPPCLCQLLWPSFKRERVVCCVFTFYFSASVIFRILPMQAAQLFNLDVLPPSCDRPLWDILKSQFTALIPPSHIFHIPADGPDSQALQACRVWCLRVALIPLLLLRTSDKNSKKMEKSRVQKPRSHRDYCDILHPCATHTYLSFKNMTSHYATG